MPTEPTDHSGHRQRMKERLLQTGLEGFNDHEALEMLLYYAVPYRDTNGLGHALVERFGGFDRALDADYADLLRTPGMSPHAATLVTLVGQMAHRYIRRQYAVGTILQTTEQLGNCVMPWFVGKKDESVVLISLDNRSRLLNTTRVFEGSVNSTQFNFRIALRQALQDNATRVVLAHNHPSGFAIPSGADVETTRRFAEVLALVGIRLVDHLIVAQDDYVSMRESLETRYLFDPSKTAPAAVSDPAAEPESCR